MGMSHWHISGKWDVFLNPEKKSIKKSAKLEKNALIFLKEFRHRRQYRAAMKAEAVSVQNQGGVDQQL